jgi:hypothetical protein
VIAVQDRLAQDDRLGAVRVHPTSSVRGESLDELTAIAIYTAWYHSGELRPAAQAPATRVNYLVIDAGAEFVQVGLIELGLNGGANGGLGLTPRLKVRTRVRSMAGDAVTTLVFQSLKSNFAAAIAPEAVAETQFGGARAGPERDVRVRNFLRFWNAAEQTKRNLGNGTGQLLVEFPKLEGGSQSSQGPLRITLDEAKLHRVLQTEAANCLGAIINLLHDDSIGACRSINRIVLAGGAAQQPIFRREVLARVLEWYSEASTRPAPPVTDHTQHPEIVAFGAATATHYAAPVGASGRFLVHFSAGPPTLPYRVVYAVGGDSYLDLFPLGTEFPIVAGQATRVTTELPADAIPSDVLSIFSCPGPLIRTSGGVFLATHLGHFDLSRGDGPVQIWLGPDHRIGASRDGRDLIFRSDTTDNAAAGLFDRGM